MHPIETQKYIVNLHTRIVNWYVIVAAMCVCMGAAAAVGTTLIQCCTFVLFWVVLCTAVMRIRKLDWEIESILILGDLPREP